ncbi:hypothetical protein [Coraliomargarita parva]|uniref:hypothetical protein n=1 Tax=Coraliomargarita parva TaxID=3014050 RepID=UPI0022B53CA0|nr:hypothetical protein [Coraliomargarita parva]
MKDLAFSNGISLQLILEEDKFLGIGVVEYQGVPLRASVLPWNFYTESEVEERAVRFETFSLEEVRQAGEAVELVLKSKGVALPRIQQADAMGEARVKSRRVEQPEALFIWRFEPIAETLYENEWQGLTMQLSYECSGMPIHWMLEQSTWEIGGVAEGATLIQQDVSTLELEKVVDAGDAFSTIEKFFTDGWGGSYPMDMLPRAAGAAICDFQAKGDTAICLFSEKPGLTRARLEKHADENVIHYLDRTYFPLSESVKVQSRKLLVHKAEVTLAKYETRNLWLDCFMEVRRRILANYDFQLEVPVPCVGAHLWDKELKERMEKWHEPIQRDLPEYQRLGYKDMFTHGVWDSITSDPREWLKGNICCPYSFTYADAFGGSEGMKTLNAVADACDIQLMQWYSFHMSKEAPVWQEHPDWVLKEANGDPWDGNYGSLWSGRIRSGYGDWFQQQIFDVQDSTGIHGIFWDSYQNLGVTGIDWGAEDKAPQADEIFRMQAQLQKRGFKQRVEVVSIFGVSQVAMFGFKNDAFRRRLWDDCAKGDHAFALLDCSTGFFCKEMLAHPERLSVEVYFWLAAHRAIPGLSADPWESGAPNKARLPGGDFAAQYGRVNHLYNAALPFMDRPRLQPEGKYILWLDANGNPAVVWVFEDVSVNGYDCATDLEAGALELKDGEYAFKAGQVYALRPEVGKLLESSMLSAT